MPDDRRPVITVADADEAIRSLVALTLDGERLDVVQAADLRELVTAVESHGPAAVVVDLHLPDQGGVEACATVKRADAAIRTVMLVAKRDLDEVRDESNVIDALLTKPFTALALLRKIDDVLDLDNDDG